MAKAKPRVKCLLISSPAGMDVLQPIVKDAIGEIDKDIQVELFSVFETNVHRRAREKDFAGSIISSDLILVDFRRLPIFSFFEIGVARGIGKPIVLIGEDLFYEDLPEIMRQSYFISYENNEDFLNKLKDFFLEYTKNPRRFIPGNLVASDTGSQIVVDLEKLGRRDFENLCFELLSRLGYNQLEWRIKDEIFDAATTLRKRDPDGFEYDEFWLISFVKDHLNNERLFDFLLHDPEYFRRFTYKNLIKPDVTDRGSASLRKGDVPVTVLFILREKGSIYKKQITELFKRDSLRFNGEHSFTIRIRWWDEQTITDLVQNNVQLARKYFSNDALTRSGVRLSYEDLYKEYVFKNEELEKTNTALIAERSRAELLERDAAWKLLSFTAAHRLGNPMDAIDTEVSNLKLAISLKKPQQLIDDIIKSIEIPIEKAKSIISQFRNLSIAHEIKPETINSQKLFEALRNATKLAVDKGVEVIYDLKNIPDVPIDIY